MQVGIVRAHLEEDAAKNVHVGGRTGRIGGADYTLVDYNRGGTPLVEIVTAPDIHSAEEAKRFLQLLRQTIVELGISDAEMEKGTLRVDANVSVRPDGLGRAPDALRDQEHELVHAHRARDRRGGRAADRGLGVGRRGRAAHVRLRRRDRARSRRAARRRRPTTTATSPSPTSSRSSHRPSSSSGCGPSCPSCRRRGSRAVAAHARPRARARARHGRARRALAGDRRGRRGRLAASNVIANQLVGAGVDPRAVDATELAKLVEARERIPRQAFDEAIAKVGEPGFSAEPYLAQEAVSDAARARADRRRGARRQPRPGRAVPRRQGRAARLLRRPGDEGDEGPGGRARGQRARAREARARRADAHARDRAARRSGLRSARDARRPEDSGISLEELRLAARNHAMPLEALRWPVTPVGLHYLLIHYDVPLVDRGELASRGRRAPSSGRSSLSLDRPPPSRRRRAGRDDGVRRATVARCSSRGRSASRGSTEAVGTARWRGVPLAALLDEAADRRGGRRRVRGARPRASKGERRAAVRAEPADRRGAGVRRGARVRDERPRRCRRSTASRSASSCPGWYGMTNVKWLTEITVLEEPFAGYQQ